MLPHYSVRGCVRWGRSFAFLGGLQGANPTGRTGAGLFMTKQGWNYQKKLVSNQRTCTVNLILLFFIGGTEH